MIIYRKDAKGEAEFSRMFSEHSRRRTGATDFVAPRAAMSRNAFAFFDARHPWRAPCGRATRVQFCSGRNGASLRRKLLSRISLAAGHGHEANHLLRFFAELVALGLEGQGPDDGRRHIGVSGAAAQQGTQLVAV